MRKIENKENIENEGNVEEENGNSQHSTTSDTNSHSLTEDQLAALAHLYAPESISDVHFRLCKHGGVPLDAVLRGELKVVQKEAAYKLIEVLSWQKNSFI